MSSACWNVLRYVLKFTAITSGTASEKGTCCSEPSRARKRLSNSRTSAADSGRQRVIRTRRAPPRMRLKRGTYPFGLVSLSLCTRERGARATKCSAEYAAAVRASSISETSLASRIPNCSMKAERSCVSIATCSTVISKVTPPIITSVALWKHVRSGRGPKCRIMPTATSPQQRYDPSASVSPSRFKKPPEIGVSERDISVAAHNLMRANSNLPQQRLIWGDFWLPARNVASMSKIQSDRLISSSLLRGSFLCRNVLNPCRTFFGASNLGWIFESGQKSSSGRITQTELPKIFSCVSSMVQICGVVANPRRPTS
ncbi:hypothetical protein DQ04_05941020 [Trypanosoma grayi]|uniref:hypothetical protein n=1 Tax=Trypanosoma grayi TaxID=71804 RepID=UPI0004F40A48|nr:hypothetical protein DQ04_05941020 [Trypanosoma grayi]KEG09036.1 hypothetical protein DQ04_05941020 [Trypanosoma grayi]